MGEQGDFGDLGDFGGAPIRHESEGLLSPGGLAQTIAR